ncbi:MAG: carboxypeptidase-like regulatory domain-containing protein [Methanomassiliicoccales archaeon]|nr:carboxypeptidase-like regulatory domain-containing protein [Methanomassiliicoccales archaeon]MDD1756857.1 carboxypeptidase-like regulatory domain-containing protein [Methanomassiliicoccales archaeon]
MAVPLILTSMEVEVTGQVVDSNGDPISGATVSTWRGSAISDENGMYSLKAIDVGKVALRAEADGHWTQKKEAKNEEGRFVASFTLIEDIVSYVPIGVIFLDLREGTKLNGTLTILSNALESERWIQIDDFAPGSDKDCRIHFGEYGSSSSSMDLWYYYVPYHATSFIEMTKVTISGVYGETPGQCENCYVRGWMGVGNNHFLFDMPDYLTPSETQIEDTIRPEASGQTSISNAPEGSYRLNDAFGVKVSVSILGMPFNCTLPVTLGPAKDAAPYISIQLYCMDNSTATVKELWEGGHVVHIWEIGT